MTPLHIAAKQGHKNSVERLLNDGTDINITDNDMVSDYTTETKLALVIGFVLACS